MSVARFVILLNLLYLFLGCGSKSSKNTESTSLRNDLVQLNKRKINGSDRKFSEAERRFRLGSYLTMSDFSDSGAILFKILKVSNNILKSAR